MLFPEIAERVRSGLSSAAKSISAIGSPPISLNLKAASSFPTEDANWYQRNGFYGNAANRFNDGATAWSGQLVNRQSALNHSAVWACNRLISETIGYIPASLMRSTNGEKSAATDHPMYSAMKNAPNDEITAQGFREMLTSHCLLEGGGFARIIRRSGTGTALELQHLLPEQVTADRDSQKRLVYIIKTDKGVVENTYTVERGKPHDILHLRGLGWDGMRGYSVIQMGRQSISTAIAGERHVASFWANGGRVPYVIEMAGKFADDPSFDKYRADLEKMMSQPNKPPIIEGGKTFKQIGLNMVDSQALESRMFTVAEICRWFGVSPHLVFDLSHATFSNVESLALEFVKMTLSTWLSRWEQDFWRCVLTPAEKSAGYFLRHNLNALLRGDFKTRMEGYASALQNGHKNADEVRDLEDLNPLPAGAGQSYHFQMNLQTTPGTGNPTIVEQGIINRGVPDQTLKEMVFGAAKPTATGD